MKIESKGMYRTNQTNRRLREKPTNGIRANIANTLFIFALCSFNSATAKPATSSFSKSNTYTKSYRIIPIFDDGKGGIAFKDIRLGMSHSVIIDKDAGIQELRSDSEIINYPKVLVSGSYDVKGSVVMYGFSDDAPVLNSMGILKKFNSIDEQEYALKDILAKFGKPSAYTTEVASSEELVMLVWRKKTVNLMVSYLPASSKLALSFTTPIRILAKDSDIESIPKKADDKSTIDLELEKAYIERLLVQVGDRATMGKLPSNGNI